MNGRSETSFIFEETKPELDLVRHTLLVVILLVEVLQERNVRFLPELLLGRIRGFLQPVALLGGCPVRMRPACWTRPRFPSLQNLAFTGRRR